MAYNENINLFVTTDRNNADVFNAPLEKIIQNIQDTREYLYQLQAELDQLESKVQSEYTPTEQLNDLLAKGIKGDKGDTGESLEYNWDGTALGVKLESESDFTYRELKGEAGDVSTEQLEQAIQEAKTELENEITNIPKVTKTSELTNDSGFITANDIPDVDLEPYALKTQIPTTLPASDVYAWAKQSTKPTYTASEVGALASNGTAVNASKVKNALTLQIAGTTKNTFNGSSAQTFNIPNASTSAPGVMTTAQVTTLNNHTTEIDNLKNTVVSGKTSVANAINGKLGTTLSNQTSFADMAYYINTIPSLGSVNKLPTRDKVVRGSFPFVKEVLRESSLTLEQTVTIDGGLIMFVEENDREVLHITPINAEIKVYKWDGKLPITVDAGKTFTTDYCSCFIFNPNRTQLSCVRNGFFPYEEVNPAIYINIS